MKEFIISNTIKFLVVTTFGFNEFSDDRTDEEYYKNTNRTILDVNVMNISLIIMSGKYGAIDTDYFSCYGYYIIKFSSLSYTLQADLIIDGQLFDQAEFYVKGIISFQSILIFHNYVSQK